MKRPLESPSDQRAYKAAVAAGCAPTWEDGTLGWAWHCTCKGNPHGMDQQCTVLRRAPRQLRPRLGWTTMTVLTLVVQSRDLHCAVFVQEVPGVLGEWSVFAVETPGKDPASVLDAHAHKIVGTFRGLTVAIDRAERYAKAWQRVREKMKAPCGCKEIEDAAH